MFVLHCPSLMKLFSIFVSNFTPNKENLCFGSTLLLPIDFPQQWRISLFLSLSPPRQLRYSSQPPDVLAAFLPGLPVACPTIALCSGFGCASSSVALKTSTGLYRSCAALANFSGLVEFGFVWPSHRFHWQTNILIKYLNLWICT